MPVDLPSVIAGWAPAPVETTARIDAWPGTAFAALLDQPSPVAADGDPLPPLWHVFHLLDAPAQADLGDDGHPGSGPFQPPIPDRRRMFAGGRLDVTAPLRVGDVVTRRSELLAATPKQGRSGASVFVTVRHELLVDGAVVQVEEQDFAYRSQPPGACPRAAGHGSGAGAGTRRPGGGRSAAAVPVQRPDLQQPPHPLRPPVRDGGGGLSRAGRARPAARAAGAGGAAPARRRTARSRRSPTG